MRNSGYTRCLSPVNKRGKAKIYFFLASPFAGALRTSSGK